MRKQKKKVLANTKDISLVYLDVETSFSKNEKPFIGHISILDDYDTVCFDKFYEDPREINAEDVHIILDLMYNNSIVCCDPTEDIKVIRHDARRCGIRVKSSSLHFLDIQLIEMLIQETTNHRRTSLVRLAAKYKLKPPVRFHDPFSDATVIKGIFKKQLKELDMNENELHNHSLFQK